MARIEHCVDMVLATRGISQKWLAQQLGISESYVTLLLSGERRWTDALKNETARLLMFPRQILFFEPVFRQRFQEVCSQTTTEA